MRLELRDVDPTVWRRLLVPDGITMADLAEILLLAMGWGDVHLHFFEVGDVSYGAADEDADDDESTSAASSCPTRSEAMMSSTSSTTSAMVGNTTW